MEILPRIRTIPQAVEELKAQDPKSAINITCLRSLVKKGLIKRVDDGGRVAYINFDSLLEYLANPTQSKNKVVGSIRHINT